MENIGVTFEIFITDKSFPIQSWPADWLAVFLSFSLSLPMDLPESCLSNGFKRHVLPNLDNGFTFMHCFTHTVVNQHDP